MILIFLVLIQICILNTSSQELGISLQRGLTEISSIPRNNIGCNCQRPNNLYPTNDLGCRCQGSNNLLMPNIKCGCRKQNIISPNACVRRKGQNIVPSNNIDCNCQKNLLPSNIGYGCQGLVGGIPPNYMKRTCKKQNTTPLNNVGCTCQNNLILPNHCGCKWQPNAVMPLNTIKLGCLSNNNVMPVNIQHFSKDCGCQGRQKYLAPSNNIGCTCDEQSIIIPKACGCKRQNSLTPFNNMGRIYSKENMIPPNNKGSIYQGQTNVFPIQNSNSFFNIDLPVKEQSTQTSRGNDLIPWTKLFDLSTRLENIAELALATTTLLTKLPKKYDVNLLFHE
ncbi:uncharacterized protein LOC120625377 [Pararge aegeria]|uniref:uncharacterized protein LOC120625377 n=1 Tax=Pararge aegeria TaxID=116150 RepID=UPI0019CFDD14|nr:uncharacterized protein LOC120625377 [Pararge aegeria]